jgi:cadmium resistance protein CadD (predicted permease)
MDTPSQYPIWRQRKLLAHLCADLDDSGIGYHYLNRYTIQGIKNLLLEFGVHAEVYDHTLYVGQYLGSEDSFYKGSASQWPLHVRVIIQYIEPRENDNNTYVGQYLGSLSPLRQGNLYLYSAKPLVTEEFIVKLCQWERAAGVQFLIEWQQTGYESLEESVLV